MGDSIQPHLHPRAEVNSSSSRDASLPGILLRPFLNS